MEHQDFELITVLKVRNICCAAYQKKLKKEVSKLDGVYSVDVNPEKSLVSVRGKVDANSLLNIVARTGKHAEIVCSNKKSSHNKCWTNKNCSCSQHHRHSCCQNHNKSKEEEHHRCEDYVPPLFDERMCRDYYSRSHRMKTNIRDSVPAGEYSGFFGRFQQHARGPFRQDLGWFMEEPRPRQPFGYGFRWGRPSPGYDDYVYYSYGNARGCI